MSATAGFLFSMVAYSILGWPLSFETQDDLVALHPSGLSVFERVQKHATDGQWALRVVFPGSQKDTWPGFGVSPPSPDLSAGQSLIFDVYNPQEQACSLSWRIDDQDRHSVFGGTSIPPQKTKRVEIWVRPLRNQLNLQRMQQFYLYYRMPREDWELFFDNFQFADPSYVFREITHVPAVRPQGLPAADGPALIAFQRPWMEHVFPDDWPAEGESTDTLSLAATPREYEPLTVSLAARRQVRALKATLSDFTGPGKIPATQADLRVVRCLDKRWIYNDEQMRYLAQTPVLLEPQPEGGLELPTGQVSSFWITLHVPAGIPPGVYEAKLTITAEESAAEAKPVLIELPVRLRVYSFELPEVADKWWGVYYTGPVALELGEDLEKMERHLIDMREHGMTSVGLCFGWDVAQTDVDGRRVDFLPPGRSRYETFMDLYTRLKFPAPLIQLHDTVQSAVGSKIRATDPLFADAYADTWKFVADYAKARKWPEIIIQPVDEPAWQGEAEKERNRQLLDILQRLAPELRTEQDGPGDDYFHKVAGPLADVWNYNGSLAEPEVIRQAKAEGKIILIYNCDVEWYRPLVDRYVAGWFQLASGADGCFNWAYQSFSGDPYDDQDAQYGDHIAHYPTTADRPGGPSVAWEGFREGIDDYKYVALLRSLTEQARKKGDKKARNLADEAERELADLLGSLSYSSHIRNSARFERYWEEEGKLFVSGVMTLPNGWDTRRYDAARRTLADLATRLKQAL